MPSRARTWRVIGCWIGIFSMLLLLSAGSALASASVRFVHAVPGSGAATVNVSVDGAGVSGSPITFGKVGEPLEVQGGKAKLTVAPAEGGGALAEAEATFEDDASYTVVALPRE